MYLQASRDKFKPKVFKRMLEKIRYEDITDILNESLKQSMVHILSNYCEV